MQKTAQEAEWFGGQAGAPIDPYSGTAEDTCKSLVASRLPGYGIKTDDRPDEHLNFEAFTYNAKATAYVTAQYLVSTAAVDEEVAGATPNPTLKIRSPGYTLVRGLGSSPIA